MKYAIDNITKEITIFPQDDVVEGYTEITEEEYNTYYFNILKEDKIIENDIKANKYRYNQEFTVTVQEQECIFDTKEKTQNDLNTATNFCLATGRTYDNWTTNNGVVLNLTLEDINIIFEEFKAKADVYTKWLEYDTAIKKAKTIEQLEKIDISYDRVDN